MSSYLYAGQRVEESKKKAGIIRNKKDTVLKGLRIINEIMETEQLVKELTDDVASGRSLIDECEKKFAEIAPQLDAKSRYFDLLQGEVRHLEEELLPMEKEILAFDVRLERQEEKASAITVFRKKRLHLENGMTSFEGKMGELQPEIDKIRSEVPREESVLSALHNRISENEQELQKLSSDAELLLERVNAKGCLADLEVELARITGSSEKSEDSVLRLSGFVEKNRALKETLSSDIGQKERNLEEVSGKVENLSREVASFRLTEGKLEHPDALQKKLSMAMEESVTLEEKCKDLKNEIDTHIRHKEVVAGEVEAASCDFEKAESVYENLKALVTPYENNPENLEVLEKDSLALDRELKDCAEAMEPLKEELKHLNKALDLVKTEHDGYSEAMAEIEALLE